MSNGMMAKFQKSLQTDLHLKVDPVNLDQIYFEELYPTLLALIKCDAQKAHTSASCEQLNEKCGGVSYRINSLGKM